jgi:nitroimidazol reductase NimA-like FMN-containing flavoprotein (pyridoxamine 5'-phosphate oxidase superfamily)
VLSPTPRTRHRRIKENGRTDRADLDAVLAAGLVAHLGVVIDGHPMVIPTVYGYDDERIFLHGSVASRSLATLDRDVCVTVTVLDGLILARSVFEHGINYRSAMIYGVPQLVTGDDLLHGLRRLTEHVAPGQWDYARRPSKKELAATRLLALPLAEASVKISDGDPSDGDGPDAALGIWAGRLPLVATWAAPVPDPLLPAGIEAPAHIAGRTGANAHPAAPAVRIAGQETGTT